ncbi:hypothetical protein FHU33_0621 [Blastococcus colisei]|uniref:Uncharacterized protein n=1 Tax=Blastococcus colisei TaxID=1564162 RepID=A0A543PAZ5_9ACTN|nr:DUF5667 domain-containing protein [Blastococcus colisei]TQN41258.1 hypothetical protein FHU33_0621 [Blastococcus colisei]
MSVHDREDALVTRLHQLAPHLDGEPDPAFQAKTRARLVAMAAVRTPEPAPASGLQRLLAVRAPAAAPARWRNRLTAGLAGATLTVTALAGLVAVADGARPGDVLYDLKRGTEQTQLALAGDVRGRTLLDFASTRLDEVAALVGEGGTALPATPAGSGDDTVSAAGADPALVIETLRTMDQQTTDAAVWLTDRAVGTGEEQPLHDLARWATGQAGELADLQPRIPEEASEAVGQSLTLLAQIGARTDGLKAAFTCPAGPAVAGADSLGPVPAPCPAPETAPPAVPGGGGGTDPTTGAVPETPTTEGTPRSPTVPPSTAPDGGLPAPVPAPSTPTTPTTPGLPDPALPSLPLPGSDGTTSSPPIIEQPPLGPIEVCAPPLVTVGC